MVKEIPLTNGGVALVDDDDYEEVSKLSWSRTDDGYVVNQRKIRLADGRKTTQRIRMHRLILDVSDEEEVDHVDMCRTNNQKSNLRVASKPQNQFNRGTPRNNKTGYKGVIYLPHHQAFRADIKAYGKSYYLGEFRTAEEAAYAYNKAATRLHGEFARLNDIPEEVIASFPPHRLRRNNTSGYTGVMYVKKYRIWVAVIKFDGQEYYLGSFDTPEEAALAYNTEAERLYGDKAWLNLVPDIFIRKTRLTRRNKSGYRGVSLVAKTGKWQAHFYHNGKGTPLGSTFSTPEEAALAYNKAASDALGDKARLNVLPTIPPPFTAPRRITYDRVDPADLPYEVPIRVPC